MTNARKAKERARAEASEGSKRKGWSWGRLIGVALAVVVVALIFKTGGEATGGAVASPKAATAFTLPATDGSQVSLSDFQGQNVLLYFNEGVGCDACFYQTVALEKDAKVLQEAGIPKVIPIVMNPVSDVQQSLVQFGIKTPYLIDADGSVSKAYHMIGTGMHANLPGHGFVLVDSSGQVKWTMNYPNMFASTKQIVKDIGNALQ